ncbi:beta-lactamase-like protein [Xylariaceae sp. FL0594]|nr:beta-lactamase-like protein [Xylariaceae sp. FL0594]
MAAQHGFAYDPIDYEPGSYDTNCTDSLLVCTACGTQFPTNDRQKARTCYICDDPRQFTPPAGQSFTTLAQLKSQGYKNTFTPITADPDTLVSIQTQPKFAIGQRAFLVRTPQGNVLFDCITFLDDETVAKIKSLGGLKAIVISHPHYYSAHLHWARTFDCPVYLSDEDQGWLAQRERAGRHQLFLREQTTDLFGTTVLKLGGHFPGSLVLLYDKRLLIADTLVTTPSGLGSYEADALGNPRETPPGLNTFAFMWSIPNMIPLGPRDIERMWAILKQHEFASTHGAFPGLDVVRSPQVMKQKLLESMQIQLLQSGHENHPLMHEKLE